MTRVNVVPVEELCDAHILTEAREITRIPNCVNSGRYNLKDQPNEYTLGTGHVKYFYSRLKWLHNRYNAVHKECLERGFNVTYKWPESVPEDLYNDAVISEHALKINRERIIARWPKKARYCGELL